MDLLFSNYRPISNLAFLSKVIERSVCFQIVDHLKSNGLYEKFQSAYTEGRSCETALIRVQNDIRMAMDKQEVTFLILLDMSAAFDTVSHDILIERLSVYCGIRGKALDWIISYLTGRRQAVNINGTLSDELPLECGVPQGSVSGPLFFLIYTLPLGDILKKHGLKYHFYADDNQDYLSFKVKDIDENVKLILACLKDIREWLGPICSEIMESKLNSQYMVPLSKLQSSRIYH